MSGSRRQINYSRPEPLGLQMTPDVVARLKGRLPKDAFGVRLYDTIRLKAAAATPTSVISLFTVPLGQNTAVQNALSETYAKSYVDTNMVSAGSLAAGQKVIVDSIQVIVSPTAALDTTYPTSGTAAELPSNPTAVSAVAAANLTSALLRQGYIKFWVGEKQYEEGLLIHFPSKYGISGFAGFGVSTNFEGVSNNGFGMEYTLPVEREIPPLVNFRVDLQFIQAITVTSNITIQIVLEGIQYRPVQ